MIVCMYVCMYVLVKKTRKLDMLKCDLTLRMPIHSKHPALFNSYARLQFTVAVGEVSVWGEGFSVRECLCPGGLCPLNCDYRLETVNSKSFVSKVLFRIKWKFELTVYFKHGMLWK